MTVDRSEKKHVCLEITFVKILCIFPGSLCRDKIDLCMFCIVNVTTCLLAIDL